MGPRVPQIPRKSSLGLFIFWFGGGGGEGPINIAKSCGAEARSLDQRNAHTHFLGRPLLFWEKSNSIHIQENLYNFVCAYKFDYPVVN